MSGVASNQTRRTGTVEVSSSGGSMGTANSQSGTGRSSRRGPNRSSSTACIRATACGSVEPRSSRRP